MPRRRDSVRVESRTFLQRSFLTLSSPLPPLLAPSRTLILPSSRHRRSLVPFKSCANRILAIPWLPTRNRARQRARISSSSDRTCRLPQEPLGTSANAIRSPGAFAISFLLPVVLYIFTFACNDISGCPVPSLLRPRSLDLELLKREAGWPDAGIWGLGSWKVTGWTLAYYLFSAVLHRVLPGTHTEGTVLANGAKLKYKFNGEWQRGLSPCAPNPANESDEQQPSARPFSPSLSASPAPSPRAASSPCGRSSPTTTCNC